jgi:NADH-ubiquinone oxidoreductase chain 5
LFIFVVLFISAIVIVYSYRYIMPYSKSPYFLWLTSLFVMAMLLVISISNFFFIILGWDGLGLISFFLIIFYQNQQSVVSGVFTLLINRLGDGFYLIRLILMFYNYRDFSVFSSNLSRNRTIFFLVLTFMTKSAIYPFSPWLPAAIAAPTPISALVHSSTLVTAGLYLMIRFSYLLYSSPAVIQVLSSVCIFTSFYAGLNTVFECDLKKIIALSTLRHLGFIGISFSLGLLHLRFFHLLVHALFKSLLFISIGDIIVSMDHSQDIRYLSKGFIYTPFSSFTLIISVLNLLGLPNISGYFSKDLILERINYCNSSLIFVFIVYVNVLSTYFYSYKLIFFRFHSPKLTPFKLFNSIYALHYVLLLLLCSFTLLFSLTFLTYFYSYIIFYFLSPALKFIPLFLNLARCLLLFVFLSLPSSSVASYSIFSSILFLNNVCKSYSSILYLNTLFNSVKRLEIGILNYSFNKLTLSYLCRVSSLIHSSLIKIHLISLLFFLSFVFLSLASLSL